MSDEDAIFEETIHIDGSSLKPKVSWGTSPEMVIDIDGTIPEASSESLSHALKYMNLKPGMKPSDIKLDQIFIGSCTNSRIEDLRIAAEVVKGKKVSDSIKRAIVVPGSGLVSAAAVEFDPEEGAAALGYLAFFADNQHPLHSLASLFLASVSVSAGFEAAPVPPAA